MAAKVFYSERQLQRETETVSALKESIQEAIYAGRDQLVQLAHEIHEHPELAFMEEYAAEHITQFLAVKGFAIRKGICGLPTAFVATYGHGPLHIAFCAEYDALPPACLGAISTASTSPEQNKLWLAEVWLNQDTPERSGGPESECSTMQHACGHNLIAGAAVAAAIGLREIADQVGLTISVFGTPGEELVGLPEPREGHLAAGKIALLEAGAFEGVHAVLMVHPGPSPWSLFIPTHVYFRQRARFSPAGVGGRPMGVPELRHLEEALKQAVAALHLVPALFAARAEGEGVDAQADLLWISRSEAEGVGSPDAVRRCFEEAASSAGVTVEIIDYAPGTDMHNDPLLSASFRKNSETLGRIRGHDVEIQEEIHNIFQSPQIPWVVRLLARLLPSRLVSPPGLFMDKVPVEIVYGTDLANISKVIPSIHPSIGIGDMAGNHTVEFAAQADSDEGYKAMLDGGVALAWTALDAATDPSIKTHLIESASTHNGSIPGKA